MLKGSCLCGGVQLEVDRLCESLDYCHCSMCRRAHGSAFAAWVVVDAADFRFTAGEELVKAFRSSQQVDRTFCSVCGSRLQFIDLRNPNPFGLSAGVLASDLQCATVRHIFVESKAPWFEITDEHARYRRWPWEESC